jgi:hypothetical protein
MTCGHCSDLDPNRGKQPARNGRGIAVVDMKLEVVVFHHNDWLLQEITTRLPGW